jgi:hypothetical protein
MDVAKILAELRQERQQIEEAIVSLERLARGRARGRGRPPAWLAAATAPKRRGRPPGSKNKVTSSAQAASNQQPPKQTAAKATGMA